MSLKENEELKNIYEKYKKKQAELFIEQSKKYGFYSKDSEKDLIESANNAFDKCNKFEDIKNHSLVCNGFDLSEYADYLRTLEGYEELIVISVGEKDIYNKYIVKDPDVPKSNSERKIVDIINTELKAHENAKFIFMHNHPYSIVANHSLIDILTYMRYKILCKHLDSDLLDSYIVSGFDIFSEVQNDKNISEKNKIGTDVAITNELLEDLKNLDIRAKYLMQIYTGKKVII